LIIIAEIVKCCGFDINNKYKVYNLPAFIHFDIYFVQNGKKTLLISKQPFYQVFIKWLFRKLLNEIYS
jgi:hypothetical protein